MALSELYTVNAKIGGLTTVHVVAGSMTGGQDHTVYTPGAEEHVFLLAEQYADSTAAVNPTYKSGSETIVTPQLAANQGVHDQVGPGWILATEKGQPLVVNPAKSVASAVYHVIVGRRWVSR